MTLDEWDEWERQDGTIAFMALIAAKRDEGKEHWSNGGFVNPSENVKEQGRQEIFNLILGKHFYEK